MKILVVAVLLTIIAGCDREFPEQPAPKRYGAAHIQVWHDDKRGVTCWLYGPSNGGISCLPDGQVGQ